MTIKECIDIVDNIKPNQYTVGDKVRWLSFIDAIIINDVLKTHEGYDGRYDLFEGYSEDKLSTPLIVPSPYDRLYTAYLQMKIDSENGETARYNNSVALYNAYMSEYRKHYNKTHMPIDATDRRNVMPQKKATVGLSEAEYENLKRDLYNLLSEYFSDAVSPDKLYDIVTSYAQNNIELLKGKDGYTPLKGVDYYTESEINKVEESLFKKVGKPDNVFFDLGDGTSSVVQKIKGIPDEKSSTASGTGSVGLGMYNKVKSHAGMAVNYNNYLSEDAKYSFAANHHNEIFADNCLVGGYFNKANASAEFIHGLYLLGEYAYQTLHGKYNIPEDAPFIIGNGKNDANRSNAFVVNWDGSFRMGNTLLNEASLNEILSLKSEMIRSRNDIESVLKEWMNWAGAANKAYYDFRLTYGKTEDFARNADLATIAKEYNDATNPNWKIADAIGDVFASYQWVKYRATSPDDFVAVTVKLPDTSGKYTAKLTYRGLYGVPSVNLYSLPINTPDIASALTFVSPVGTLELSKKDSSGTQNIVGDMGEVCVLPSEVGKERIFVLKAAQSLYDPTEISAGGVGAYGFYFKALSLDGTEK